MEWYLDNEPWWRALQSRKGVGERLGVSTVTGADAKDRSVGA